MEQESNKFYQFFNYLNSIKTKLIFSFLVITLTPLIYISYTMLNNATDGLLKVIVNNSLAHARKASIDMNSFVAHQLEIIKPFTNSEVSKRPRSQEYKRIIENFDNQYVSIEKIIVCEKFGQIIWVSNNIPTTPYSNITEIRDKLENRQKYDP